jgi:RNA polymerase sigma-70 factor (ECF subfamily)
VTAAGSDTEALLLARLRAGDEPAFAELVRSSGPRLLATLRRMLRREDDAQDALQETFLAAHRHLRDFAGQSKLSTWLHRIAVNVALMRLRAQKRRPEASIEELLPRFEDDGHRVLEPAAPELSPELELDAESRRRTVRDCIDALPESHRSVLVLRDIEELSGEETAVLLGISAEAAKMRLHRARQALRTLLEREQLFADAPAARTRTAAAGARRAAG